MPLSLFSRARGRVAQLREKLPVHSLVFDRHIGLDRTVILASMGRSGSTLVSNIINCDNSYRVLFEPFRFDRVRAARDFVYPCYLRPDNTDSRLYAAARKILAGQVHSPWVDKENRAIFPQRRLIKEIRINMILKWLHNRFPEVKIVFLVRHPCAVVESWLAMRFGMGPAALDRLCAVPEFVADIGEEILAEYRKAGPGFESLVFLWCVSHWVPFHQLSKNDVHLLFYEDLLLDPDLELERLFAFLGHPYARRKALRMLAQPSSTARSVGAGRAQGYAFDGWLARVSPRQVERTFEIMRLFGLESLYSSVTAQPDREAALRLFGAI